MPARIEPGACPQCETALAIDYEERRHARMPPHAVLLLRAGLGVTIVLLPVLLVVVDALAEPLIASLGMRRLEQWFLRGLADLLSIPVSVLPGWLSWRYAHSRPRRLALSCRVCAWFGICRLVEIDPRELPLPEPSGAILPPPAEELQINGIPNPDNVARKRLERVVERRRRENRAMEADAEPNPDFDFGSGPAEPPPATS